jgi:dihydroorotate dehydrogenase
MPPAGVMSGKPLMQLSLAAIRDFREAFGDSVTLIGGGGITSVDDARTYLSTGADHVALGSMLFNPLNWLKGRDMEIALMQFHPEAWWRNHEASN